MIIGTETAEEIVLLVLCEADYDLAKYYDEQTSEDWETAKEQLAEMATAVRMYLKGVSE